MPSLLRLIGSQSCDWGVRMAGLGAMRRSVRSFQPTARSPTTITSTNVQALRQMAGRTGRTLTIDTGGGGGGGEAEPVAPVPDRLGPHGTPRSSTSWFASTTPLPAGTDPRSWLQSPRKWGQGRTPTHGARGAGNLTPTSKRTAAYLATVQQRSGDELFGPEDEHDDKGAAQPGGSTKPATTVNLGSIVTQTDKDGRSLPVQQPPQPQQQVDPKKPVSSSAAASSSSLLGRLLGRFSQLTTAEVPPTAATTSTTASPATPSSSQPLLGSPLPEDAGRKCLVLDLDETLCHSSFQPVDTADFVVKIKIEQTWHEVYVTKRPGVDDFLQRVARDYEVVVFTASLSLYADPLLDILDVHRCVRRRLYREHCTFSGGAYIKDLALLGRDVGQTIIVDNSPLSFLYHPQNAVACSSFIDEKSDTELDVIAAFLEDVRDAPDVREHCHLWRTWEQKPRTQAGGPLQKASQHHGKKQGKRGFVQAG